MGPYFSSGQEEQQQRPIVPAHVEQLSIKRRRIFGSDSGDEEGELCGPMLRVVWGLWGGFDFDDDI